MPTYCCDICNFSTVLKSNYTSHVASKKHIRFTQIKPADNTKQPTDNPKTTIKLEKVATEFTCKYCERQFRFRQSMNRHIKYTCTKNKEKYLKECVELLEKRIEQQETNIEKQKQLFHTIINEQSLLIDKLMRNVEIHGSFNTTNNIQNIHLVTGDTPEELYKRLVERQESYAKSTESLETIL